VAVAVAGRVVSIDVIDNGMGFPKENRQRLLEPYMTTRADGTGLGLPIVAKILADHAAASNYGCTGRAWCLGPDVFSFGT